MKNNDEEKFMKAINLNGSFNGQAEGNSHFFTGFYVINKDYKDNFIPNIKIKQYGIRQLNILVLYLHFEVGIGVKNALNFAVKGLDQQIFIYLSLIEYIEKIDNKYTILLGDFNAAEKGDTVNYICENDKFLKLIRAKGFRELKIEKEKKDNQGHPTYYTKKEEKNQIIYWCQKHFMMNLIMKLNIWIK